MSDPARLRLLATAVARRPLDVARTQPGEVAFTDGACVFVTDAPLDEQRRQVLLQAALLAAGSLDAGIVRGFRGRPKVARRYLTLEGNRVLHDLARSVRGAAALAPRLIAPVTADAAESVVRAASRAVVEEPPEWFGQIRPSKLLRSSTGTSVAPSTTDVKLELRESEFAEADDDDEHEEGGKLLKLFQNPLAGSNPFANLMLNLLGASRQAGDGQPGGEMQANSLRAADTVGPHARPIPTPIPVRIAVDATGLTSGLRGARYPEWDDHHQQYKPEWCRVLEIPPTPATDPTGASTERDELLRRRLARIRLGPLVQRRRADGDDLDVDALIDLEVDLRAGHSPNEHVYLERRNLRRELGVLILLDASGSGTERDAQGDSVYEHQRRAAATLVATLEELGDRVALYGFRSRGRNWVQMFPFKTFGGRFGVGGRGALAQLEPSGYTRLGAAIRHAGHLVKDEAGTPHRLLVILSDGFPYDEGYEDGYAEADARRALVEVRGDGVAVLCLSIGASTSTEALDRVFGSAAHAGAPRLDQLSGRMDRLILGSLKELARPVRPNDGRSARRRGATRRPRPRVR